VPGPRVYRATDAVGIPAAAESRRVPVSLGSLSFLGGLDIWIVPGLLLGVPGLLVALFALLQAGGALAWVPAIRRLRGVEGTTAPSP